MGETDPHGRLLRDLGLLAPAHRALVTYLDLLATWGDRMNLTAARTPQDRVDVLVRDALIAAQHVIGPGLLDIGSGNGSPGLVLALARPELHVVLLEPRARRWAFLREAARSVGRPEIEILRTRVEDYRGSAVQTATLRAVGIPLGAIGHVVESSGRALVFGGSPETEPPFQFEGVFPLWRSQLHVFRRERST